MRVQVFPDYPDWFPELFSTFILFATILVDLPIFNKWLFKNLWKREIAVNYLKKKTKAKKHINTKNTKTQIDSPFRTNA